MDVREKLVDERVELADIISYAMRDWDDYIDECRETETPPIYGFEDFIADGVLSADYRKQEWISVKDRLPEENEYVMIWCGEFQIAKIEKGITEKERELMKSGEINDPVEIGWNMSDGHFKLKRSESYRACDEGFNNKVPYCWYVNGGMMKLFGQNVTHWMPLPDLPQKEA